ncbi:hypothetical protein [Congzhengia sp.]|jgi:hypothetical protein|uniref:hypothetical protein n=1 Tax=Congzhengia sp. TaxID=2944168 RepID=UPI0015B07841|nr:hypothetical protein [Clostridiales bacterium]DAI53581.1 MAG TPA: hypothetical protein [Caudoviricetes sp.]
MVAKVMEIGGIIICYLFYLLYAAFWLFITWALVGTAALYWLEHKGYHGVLRSMEYSILKMRSALQNEDKIIKLLNIAIEQDLPRLKNKYIAYFALQTAYENRIFNELEHLKIRCNSFWIKLLFIVSNTYRKKLKSLNAEFKEVEQLHFLAEAQEYIIKHEIHSIIKEEQNQKNQ